MNVRETKRLVRLVRRLPPLVFHKKYYMYQNFFHVFYKFTSRL